MKHGRAFARVVIPHRHDDAAMFRGPRHIGVPHHIAGPIHTGPLAIPQTENTVIFTFAAQFCLLGSPDRGGGKVFVQTLLEHDIGCGQFFGSAAHLEINRPQGRSAIPRAKSRCI